MTAFAQALLVLLLQSTGLLLLGLLALRLTRRHGPALQTLIGRTTLAGGVLLLLLLPLTGHVQPVVRVRLPEPTSVQSQPSEPIPPEPTPPQAATLPKGKGKEFQTSPPPISPRPPLWGGPLRSNLLRSKEVGSEAHGQKIGFLALLWLLITSALLLWLAACQWHLTRLRRTARLITSGPAVDLLTALTSNPPRLLTHPSVHSPFLAGLRRPAIFLPMSYEADFDADALRAILAHELAHRDRRDNAWTLAARLLTALLWPQPLLWLLCRRLEEISEDACDEAVLAQNCPPRAYAACLLTLAERWQPSRRERVLGAGVTPFRSSVGRRIKQILMADRPRRSITRSLRFGVTACAILAVSGSFVLLNAGPVTDVPHFLWAKQQGWAVQPIRIIDIDHPGLTRTAWLPYGITERDKATVKQLNQITEDCCGGPVSQKARLEAVLAEQPHFFYAEYLLGSWYRQHGDTARAAIFQTQALQDAPVVLAGRYEYNDGSPFVGFQFGTTLNCYNPKHLAAANAAFQNLPVKLQYSDVATDADGCYYLPAFQAIYGQEGVNWYGNQLNTLTASHLKAHAALITPGTPTSGVTGSSDGERLDKGFIAESRVAVLPKTEVRPVIALNAPFNAAEGSMQKPLPIRGSTLTVSWRPYPKAVQYIVRVYESRPYYYSENGKVNGTYRTTELQASAVNPSRLGLPTSQTSIRLDLIGSDPVFSRTYSYSLTVEAQDSHGEEVSRSEQYAFKPLNALAPEPLIKAALVQALGPGFVVQSIQSQKDKVIANVLTPANLQWTLAMSDTIEASGKRFGFSDYAGWSSAPGVNMNEVNTAQIMHIIYNRNTF